MRRDPGQLILGVVLVVLGTALVLERTGLIGSFSVWSLWPIIIIAGGISTFMAGPSARLIGGIITGIGVILLAQSLDIVSGSVWGIVGALVLIGFGAWILLRREVPLVSVFSSGQQNETNANDRIELTTIFSEREIVSTATDLRQVTVTTVFGEVDLDLSRANVAPAGASVDVTAVFAEATIIAPPGWNVTVNGTAILGEVNDKTAPRKEPGLPTLAIQATAIFGEVTVKQYAHETVR